jgi:hypothetical protein
MMQEAIICPDFCVRALCGLAAEHLQKGAKSGTFSVVDR